MALTNGKFKGKGLSLTIDSIEYRVDASSVLMDFEDADNDVVTFADLDNGGDKQWFFAISAVSDYATNSLWSYIWDNSGDDDIAFVFKPYGNSTASATQPHFTGTLTIGDRPAVGGEADSTFTFETRFDIDGTPLKVIA